MSVIQFNKRLEFFISSTLLLNILPIKVADCSAIFVGRDILGKIPHDISYQKKY